MKEALKLNNEISIDLPKLIESKLLVQANSGGGKSWALRRILEQSHGKVQHIILDSEGEFGTLREKYDYVLAGKGGDTPAEPRSAALLARKLLELNVSAIIDLYELHPQERKRFVKLFLDSLINAPKELWHDCIVVIDEAHTYAPEKGQSEAMDAVIGLCALGRKRGFCAVLATQRISKLHKDAAAECNNKLIGRASQDIDMKRAADELGFTSREQMLSLRSLKPGEFYVFGPAISDEVQKVTVGDVYTTHPKAGSRSLTKVVPPTAGIKKILGKLADLPQEAEKEANTINDLRKMNGELKRENEILKRTPGARDPKVIQEALAQETERTTREVEQRKDREFQEERLAWQRYNKEWQSILDAWIKYAKQLMQIVSNIGRITADLTKVKEPEMMMPDGETPKPIRLAKIAPAPLKKIIPPTSQLSHVEHSENGLSGPEQRVLNALAWCGSIGNTRPPNELVAFLSGYSHFRSTGYTNPRGYLKTKGLIDYSSGSVYLTDAGRSLAQTPSAPLTQEELHDAVLKKLDGPEQRLLKPLLEKYPNGISNTELCAVAGYMHERSTGYTNPRGRLKSFGLIEYEAGNVKAKSLLFP